MDVQKCELEGQTKGSGCMRVGPPDFTPLLASKALGNRMWGLVSWHTGSAEPVRERWLRRCGSDSKSNRTKDYRIVVAPRQSRKPMPACVRLTDEEHTMVDEIAARAVELLGQAEPVSRQPRKETLMSFREGHLFMALKLVTPFDKVSQTYLDPIPKIVLMVDGKYVRMPVDGDLIGSFGSFLCRMSKALEGVKVPKKEIDMDKVLRRMREVSATQ